jgi:multisubunit Na+/H+ antiporter MnhC subunit
MSEIPDRTRNDPVARVVVWTAILVVAATFWFVVAMVAIAWLRQN